jgi:endonuclease/exonuclease/phosphatase family metal-dependent hydrolase
MPAFRIATYNVLWGGVGREDAIHDVLRGIAPDVAVLTELTTLASLDALAPAIGSHTAISGPAGWKERTGIVSRWPIVSSRAFGPPWNRRKWIEATIQPPDGPPVRVCGVALAAHQMWTHEVWRRAEVSYLLAAVRAPIDHALLLAGDFNTIARGDAVALDREPMYVRATRWPQFGMIAQGSIAPLARAGFTDCYRACHPDASGFTIASHNPTARIDYIFASAALRPRLRGCDVVDAGAASDHLPVYADFA